MAAGQNIELARFSGNFTNRVRVALAAFRNSPHDDAGVVEEPIGPTKLEEAVSEYQHQPQHLDFPESTAVGDRDGEVASDLKNTIGRIQKGKAAPDRQQGG
ncbi:hypothetical protein BKI51_07530 [Alphaproteobacteria bacterium AO1-B]|nr:hypothetical protein BKI51_07530 [Alphaproteobacteria bacterium AO1-B]